MIPNVAQWIENKITFFQFLIKKIILIYWKIHVIESVRT